MVAREVAGIQSNNITGCIKHWVNNNEEYDRCEECTAKKAYSVDRSHSHILLLLLQARHVLRGRPAHGLRDVLRALRCCRGCGGRFRE